MIRYKLYEIDYIIAESGKSKNLRKLIIYVYNRTWTFHHDRLATGLFAEPFRHDRFTTVQFRILGRGGIRFYKIYHGA
jgi:hypothetical protein